MSSISVSAAISVLTLSFVASRASAICLFCCRENKENNGASVELANDNNFVITDIGKLSINDWRWFSNSVSKDKFDKLEALLIKHDLQYIKNPEQISLCCQKLTEESQLLLLQNYIQEKVLAVSFSELVTVGNAAFYIKEYTAEDEKFQLGIIRERIHKTLHAYEYEEFDTPLFARIYSSESRAKNALKAKSNEGKRIIRVFSTREALVAKTNENVPIERYFDKDCGILNTRFAYCSNCEKGLQSKLVDNLIKMHGPGNIPDHELVSRRESSGYEVDPKRLSINILHTHILGNN